MENVLRVAASKRCMVSDVIGFVLTERKKSNIVPSLSGTELGPNHLWTPTEI